MTEFSVKFNVILLIIIIIISLLGSPSGWISCKGWADRAADRPCCFQTVKGNSAADSMMGRGAEATSSAGGAHAMVRRQLVMPRTGREWEMPNETKPASVREWRELLPDDIAELRGGHVGVKDDGEEEGMGAAAAVVVKGEGM